MKFISKSTTQNDAEHQSTMPSDTDSTRMQTCPRKCSECRTQGLGGGTLTSPPSNSSTEAGHANANGVYQT
eukprot:1616168-Amphidinium_carterae.2